MSQALYKRFQSGIARWRPALQPVDDLHVRQIQQPFQCGGLARLKCSAVRRQKATQPEIEFEQPPPATPGQHVRHGVSPRVI